MKSKNIAQQVTVSSITLRVHENQDKIRVLNAGPLSLCQEEHATFVNHGPSFKMDLYVILYGWKVVSANRVLAIWFKILTFPFKMV